MPSLTIIAGCNGAGKSTFATSFLPEGLTSFDYDRIFLEHYNSLPDSELREDVARHRIQVRTEFKGHFVNNQTIDLKWEAGYKNLNSNFMFFDNLLFVDNSKQNRIYTNILQIEDKEVVPMVDSIPDYFKHRLPNIYKFITEIKK